MALHVRAGTWLSEWAHLMCEVPCFTPHHGARIPSRSVSKRSSLKHWKHSCICILLKTVTPIVHTLKSGYRPHPTIIRSSASSALTIRSFAHGRFDRFKPRALCGLWYCMESVWPVWCLCGTVWCLWGLCGVSVVLCGVCPAQNLMQVRVGWGAG
jgi:hypothetical protein